MTIDVRFATDVFEAVGFQLDSACRVSGDVVFRHTVGDGLYGLVWISRHGKRKEVVAGRVYCSLTRGQLRSLGLFTSEPLLQMIEDPERKATLITTKEQARQWVRRLVAVGPPAAAALCDRTAAQLLQSTADARAAVERYAQYVRSIASRDQWIDALKSSATSDEVAAAERLAGAVGVVRVRSAAFMFEVACLTLCLYERDAEGTDRIRNSVPLDDLPTMHRILLLVQKLYGEDDDLWQEYRTDC